MGYSQYFEVWPDALALRLTSDPETWRAFRALWGNCSGMHGWFGELGQDELEEIAEDSSVEGVDRVRRLLAESDVHPNAFLYKSLGYHEAILKQAFDGPDGAHAARLAIYGGAPIGLGTGFWVTSQLQCQELAERLTSTSLVAAINAFASGSDSVFPSAEDLRNELDQLRELYRCAAEGGHQVITGAP